MNLLLKKLYETFIEPFTKGFRTFRRNVAWWAGGKVPRNPRLWVFGGVLGRHFTDNTRAVFEYVHHHVPDIEAVWLTRDYTIQETLTRMGYRAEYVNSFRGWLTTARAGAIFLITSVSDVNRYGSSHGFRAMLWHGTPLKKLRYDDKFTYHRILARHARRRRVAKYVGEEYDMLISPSEAVSPRIQSAFNMPPELVPITGYPRHDIIRHAPEPDSDVLNAIMYRWGAERFVLYAPTWRDDRQHEHLIEGLDLERLSKILIAHKAVMLVKTHDRDVTNDVWETVNPDRMPIVWLNMQKNPYLDINALLPRTDVLVTDYSSVYFDYLVLDRPIVFAALDLIRYVGKNRELYEPYEEATPGPKAFTWDEAIGLIEKALDGDDGYGPERAAALDKYVKWRDDQNSARVVDYVRWRVGIGERPAWYDGPEPPPWHPGAPRQFGEWGSDEADL